MSKEDLRVYNQSYIEMLEERIEIDIKNTLEEIEELKSQLGPQN